MSLSVADEPEIKKFPGSEVTAALLIQFVVQLIAGGILSLSYLHTPAQAHASVAGMHQGALRWMQGLHYWGSALMIAESLLLLLVATWQGWYSRPFGWRYVVIVILPLLAFGFQMTGNLLPFDKHGVETANVEASIIARTPGVGASAREFALHGPSLSGSTLSLWYGIHWALTLGVLALLAMTYWTTRKESKEGFQNRWVAGLALAPFVAAVLVSSPFGTGATPDDYNAFDAKASWYTWPLHGAMQFMDHLRVGLGWMGSMLAPSMVVLVMLSLPLVGTKLPRNVVRAFLALVVLFFGGSALFYGGSFAPLIGTRDPVVAVATQSAVEKGKQNKQMAAQGRALFNSQGCSGCHGVDGLKGQSGPTLTNIYKQHSDAAFFEKYIHGPTSVDPQSTMPAFPSLTAQQLSEIAEYLRYPLAKK